MNITKEKFDAYEAVRESGVTNMLDIRLVSVLSGLELYEVIDIIRNYSKYHNQFVK